MDEVNLLGPRGPRLRILGISHVHGHHQRLLDLHIVACGEVELGEAPSLRGDAGRRIFHKADVIPENPGVFVFLSAKSELKQA